MAAAAVLGVAALVLLDFLQAPRELFHTLTHDRHRHLVEAQRLAVLLGAGDVLGLLGELESMRLYPPLHGLLAGVGLWASGMDWRAATAPSLMGFALCAGAAFGLVRAAAPRHGALAGAVAALFVVGSPMHRRFAADVMLESLGAGLTLVCVGLQAARARSVVRARWLGAALTALLLLKYNYWLLVVAAFLLQSIFEQPVLWRRGRAALRSLASRARLRAGLRSPWLVAAGLALAAALAIGVSGGVVLEWRGWRLTATKPYGALQLAYLALLVLVVRWARGPGRGTLAGLDPWLRTLIRWHGLPALVFFALPKRIGYFLRLVGPGNVQETSSPLDGLLYYGGHWLGSYHAGWPAAALAVALAGAAFWLGCRETRSAARPIGILLALAAVLTLLHPNHQARYLHSWVAGLWLLSGLGVVALLARVPAGAPRRGVAGGLLVLATATVAPALLADPHPAARPQAPSALDVSDAYLAAVDRPSSAVLLANLPVAAFAEWTWVDRFGPEVPAPQVLPCTLADAGLAARLGARPPELWIELEVASRSKLASAAPACPSRPMPERVGREARLLAQRTLEAHATRLRVWRASPSSTPPPASR